MPGRVTLDAMIRREDFAIEGEEKPVAVNLFSDFPIRHLEKDAPILKLLRKPDFQRETNQWSPEQLATFIASFLDQEVIPSLILWKSTSFVFVIDGGHRLSALRAWMEDDYGDRAISQEFYSGEISDAQKRMANHTRKVIEKKIGRFTTLKGLVGQTSQDVQTRRANALFTRTIPVQWIQGSADVAETSFFKINSQGTPLDETEEMLIKNRRKPIAIAARAILRAGTGHKYWSRFATETVLEIEGRAAEFYQLLFQPEVKEPLKTLDIPLGGSISPIYALALLVNFLEISGSREELAKTIDGYADDNKGQATIDILGKSLDVVNRFTGNSPASLGLHPAVYFYNEKGKHSQFLFLGMTLLLTEKLRNNDSSFFKKFTKARAKIENFLIENKALIGLMLQNMGRKQRTPKMRDLLEFLVDTVNSGAALAPEAMIKHLGYTGRVFDLKSTQIGPSFSDGTKSEIFVVKALDAALPCPECGGKLDPSKSVSYDHVVPKSKGGDGSLDNVNMVHPYCNSIKGGEVKEL